MRFWVTPNVLMSWGMYLFLTEYILCLRENGWSCSDDKGLTIGICREYQSKHLKHVLFHVLLTTHKFPSRWVKTHHEAWWSQLQVKFLPVQLPDKACTPLDPRACNRSDHLGHLSQMRFNSQDEKLWEKKYYICVGWQNSSSYPCWCLLPP